MSPPNPLIVDAIEHKKRLGFVYNDTPRVAEPQCYGIGTKGTELLRAHVVHGGRPLPAALFDVTKIVNLVALDQCPEGHYIREARSGLSKERLGDGDDLRAALIARLRQGAGVASGLPFSTTYTPTSLIGSVPGLCASWTTPAGITNDSPAFTMRAGWPSTSSSA